MKTTTIYVGGTKHGTEYVSHHRMVPNDAGGLNITVEPPPPSLVDGATGEKYVLAPVVLTLLHPITSRPDRAIENIVYMVDGLQADAQMSGMALGDAVLRWWFTTHGTPRALSTPDSNGHVDGVPVYVAGCKECDLTRKFSSRLDRARWIADHTEAMPGHTVTWHDDTAPPTIKGVNDGSNSPGNIQEG